jgi:hypothetical protein
MLEGQEHCVAVGQKNMKLGLSYGGGRVKQWCNVNGERQFLSKECSNFLLERWVDGMFAGDFDLIKKVRVSYVEPKKIGFERRHVQFNDININWVDAGAATSPHCDALRDSKTPPHASLLSPHQQATRHARTCEKNHAQTHRLSQQGIPCEPLSQKTCSSRHKDMLQ